MASGAVGGGVSTSAPGSFFMCKSSGGLSDLPSFSGNSLLAFIIFENLSLVSYFTTIPFLRFESMS